MKNKNLNVHFKSEKQNWETPKLLFDELNSEFNFTLDVCASYDNTKCSKFFGQQSAYSDCFVDGLKQDWSKDICWMNPPYSQSKDWIKKASEEADKGTTVVALLPARTDTQAFHTYIYKQPNVEIRFLKGRLKFVGAEHAAPFPSMVVIFKGNNL